MLPSSKRNEQLLDTFLPAKTPKEAFKNIRNYLAGQHIGASRDDILLDEVMKCLFCKLMIENGNAKPLNRNDDPIKLSNDAKAIFSQVRSQFQEIYHADSDILLDPETLSFVFNQIDFSIMDAESDPIGDAFEVFIGSESKGNAGQFFTPRSVTKLLVEAIAPNTWETILDPACGAGGFLTSTCAYIKQNGAPIDTLNDFVATNVYGIDKDAYLVKLAKVHLSLLTGKQPKIFLGDSISLQNSKEELTKHFPKDGFDVILTNPPFGSKIIAALPEVLGQFQLAKRWITDKKTGITIPSDKLQNNVPPQVLFIERCISLLKIGGRLGMVLPESLLSNKSYRYVMEYLHCTAEVHAVMGMPEALFKTSGKGGTHTKTCLIIATKKAAHSQRNSTVFMAEAKWCGQDSRARLIPNNDLPEITRKYRDYKAGLSLETSPCGFVVERIKIKNSVLCPKYYDPQVNIELDPLRKSHNLVAFGDLVNCGILSVTTGDEVGKLAYGTGTIPFIRTSDISNWEIKCDPKHGVSKQIFDILKTKQDVQTDDILMVKDGSYLIGTCAIITQADKDILYQSHIYKIRVNSNDLGLNPYLLLVLLSSAIVQKQIKSKQFTQDIIDSLGERINELLLPIPKEISIREEITSLVKQAIDFKIQARELSRQARLKVIGSEDC